jgi:hypothetical protein
MLREMLLITHTNYHRTIKSDDNNFNMDKIIFKVEKNADGYWSRRVESAGVIGAYGET